MKFKKWLSTFLVAVLLLNIVLSVDVSAETSTDPVVVTKYVSATGSDDTGDGTAGSPYATISKAEGVIEANATADEGKIIISGSVAFTAASHTKMITITGDGNTGTELSLVAEGAPVRIYGPTTIEAITLKTPSSYVNNGLLKTYTDELILGKGVVVSGSTHAYFRVGNLDWEAGNASGTGSTPALTIDEISHSDSTKNIQLRIGTGGGAWMNGANITINGGKVEDINFHRATQFSKNVNLVINGGTIGTIRKQTAASFTGTYKFHKALQIIFNNGSRDNVTTFDKDSIDGIEDVGGKWYMYGGTGGSLSTTDTAGTFKVNGENYAKIVSMSDSTIYCGEPGQTVTVPAGEYTVTYSADRPSGTLNEVTKYVSATGDDTNGDGTQENPYATVAKAEEVLQADSTADMGRIILSGSVSFAAAAHTKMITITGDGAEGTQLSLDGLKRILGPTTIENVTLYNNTNGQSLTTQGQQLVFGEGVTVKYDTYKVLTLLAGDGWQGVTSGRATMEINSFSGLAPVVQVGSVQISSPVTLTGADIVLNGGTLNQINLCPTGKGITYTENVNVTVNGGNPGLIQVNQPATFQKALQIVLNNGVSASKIDANVTTNATIEGGKWIMCGDKTAGSLSTTETAGTFKVNSEKYAKVTSKSTGEVTWGLPGETVTVPAGEYTVTYTDSAPGAPARVVTKYVSATAGDDTNGDGTQAKPYATIKKAEEVLEADTTADEGKIILSGSVTFSAAAHTKMMTIAGDGAADTKLVLNTFARLNGATTIENVTMHKTAPNGTVNLITGRDKLVFGEGVKVTRDTGLDAILVLEVGDYFMEKDSIGSMPALEVNSMSGAAVLVRTGGESLNADARNIPGANVVVNGGNVNQVDVAPMDGIVYTGDVNITFNGGTIENDVWSKNTATFQGAFQYVVNTGYGNKKVRKAALQDKVVAAKGSWYMYDDVDETGADSRYVRTDIKQFGGCRLETTPTAGTFNVINPCSTYTVTEANQSVQYTNPDTVYAIATNLQNPSLVYYSSAATADEKGTLTVPAGEWVITYSETLPDWYCTGTQVVFNKTVTNFKLSSVKTLEYEDKIIVGWMNGSALASDGTYEAGTRLDAVFAEKTKRANFKISGTDIGPSQEVESKMIYVNSTTTEGGKVLGMLAQNLEKNTQYTISFKCKVAEGNFENQSNDSVILKVRKGSLRGGTTLCESNVTLGSEKGFNSYKLGTDGYTRTYTFTTDATSTNYAINFEFAKAMKMYFADFKVYKTSDETKTNVLPISEYSDALLTDADAKRIPGMCGWDADYPTLVKYNDTKTQMTFGNAESTFYTATLMPYDAETIFVPENGALRFTIDVNLGLYGELNAFECGVIAIDAAKVPYKDSADIEIGGTYSGKTPAVIKAKNIYRIADNNLTYTLCLKDIADTAAGYNTDYMIRGYLKYTDKHGNTRVLYSDFEQSSIKATVEKMIADENVRTGVKNTLQEKYMPVINAERARLAELYKGDGTSEYNITMDDGISSSSFKVREITVDKLASSGSDPLTLVQLSDMHINNLNKKDFVDNRQTVLSYYRNRKYAKDAEYAGVAQRALTYADAVADQVIITGDTLDNLNEGTLDINKRLVWSRYPNIISTTGNHDWEEATVGKIVENFDKEVALQRLQKDARHDRLYSSKVMNNVMLIQMDNAAKTGDGYGYEASQITKLTEDLALAQSKGYTVLIFQHVPLPTDDSDARFKEIKTPDTLKSDAPEKAREYAANNEQMINLIKANSGIIKAIFCGHEHATADTYVGGIPQYVSNANHYNGGYAVKILVK